MLRWLMAYWPIALVALIKKSFASKKIAAVPSPTVPLNRSIPLRNGKFPRACNACPADGTQVGFVGTVEPEIGATQGVDPGDRKSVFQRFFLTSKGWYQWHLPRWRIENWRVDIGSIDSDRWLVEWLLELEWLVVIIDCWWCMMSNDGWKTRNSRTSASVAPNGVSSQVIIQY